MSSCRISSFWQDRAILPSQWVPGYHGTCLGTFQSTLWSTQHPKSNKGSGPEFIESLNYVETSTAYLLIELCIGDSRLNPVSTWDSCTAKGNSANFWWRGGGHKEHLYCTTNNCTVPEGMLRMIVVHGFQPNMYCYSCHCSCTPIVQHIMYIFVHVILTFNKPYIT